MGNTNLRIKKYSKQLIDVESSVGDRPVKRELEDSLVDRLDEELMESKIKKEIFPLISTYLKYARDGDVSKFVKSGSGFAMFQIFYLMLFGKSESIKLRAAKEFKDTGGHKPVERKMTANLNIENMNDDQLKAALRDKLLNYLNKLSSDEKDIVLRLTERHAKEYE